MLKNLILCHQNVWNVGIFVSLFSLCLFIHFCSVFRQHTMVNCFRKPFERLVGNTRQRQPHINWIWNTRRSLFGYHRRRRRHRTSLFQKSIYCFVSPQAHKQIKLRHNLSNDETAEKKSTIQPYRHNSEESKREKCENTQIEMNCSDVCTKLVALVLIIELWKTISFNLCALYSFKKEDLQADSKNLIIGKSRLDITPWVSILYPFNENIHLSLNKQQRKLKMRIIVYNAYPTQATQSHVYQSTQR